MATSEDALKDRFMQTRDEIKEMLMCCLSRLSEVLTDPTSRNQAVAKEFENIIEDVKKLRSRARREAAEKRGKIPECFFERTRVMQDQLRIFIEMLQGGARWEVYVMIGADLLLGYVGRTTLHEDIRNDPSAAQMDNQWSAETEQYLQGDIVKNLIQTAVNSMGGDGDTAELYKQFHDAIQNTWNVLNAPLVTCDCRQCKVRRGFSVRFLE